MAVVSSLVERRWVGPRALWRLWRGAMVGGLVPGACLWLGPSWLGLGFSFALTVCGSWALFFVSSWGVGLIGVFSMVMLMLVGWPPCWLSVSCASAAAGSGAGVWCRWGAFGPQVAWAAVRSGAVVLLLLTFLFIVAPVVGVCGCSVFCSALLCVHSSIAIILMGKRELVALLNFSSWGH